MPMQTCKTIIFEEFNRDQDDLSTILENTDDPESNKLVEKIDELSVNSFSQFMEKFAPVVYEVCQTVDGHIRFFYTIDKDELKGIHYSERSKITDQEYYKMLLRLYSEKGISGKPNSQFKDDEILEMLTPKQEIQSARNIRKSLAYNLKEYYNAEEKGESTEEFQNKISECRKKIIDQYSGTQSTMIPILLEDLKTKKKRLEQSKLSVATDDDYSDIPRLGSGKSGDLYIDGNGLLKIEEPKENRLTILPKNPTENTQTEEHDIGEELAVILEQDYNNNADNANDFVKNLIVSTYAPTAVAPVTQNLTTEEIDETIENYNLQINELEDVYCKARENFINELSKVIESLLGVKIFFDHATVDGGDDGKLPESVIIANCKASKLLSIEDKFKKFIKHRGKDQISNRIWFAVLPNVMEKNISPKNTRSKKSGPFADLNIKKNQNEVDSAEFTSVNSALKFLDIMEEARITTVMNIRSKEGNTFSDLSVDEIKSKMDRLPVDKAHAVYAYPNFTLARERPGFKPFKPYSERTISLPGIYIDAAYPAAGLLVASQQIDCLERRGFKGRVNKENVCVRIDFESEEIKKNLVTKFNRESALRWSEALRNEINKNMFGFVFCSDEVYDNGQPLKNSYVYCSRTLKKNKNGYYKPIYQTLMEDYVAQCLKSGISNKLADVNKFINNTVKGNWIVQSSRPSLQNNVNLILQLNESIDIDEEKKKVVIHFINDESTIDDFDISSEND